MPDKSPEVKYRLLTNMSVSKTYPVPSDDWLEFTAGKTYPASAFPAHFSPAAEIAAGYMEEVRHG